MQHIYQPRVGHLKNSVVGRQYFRQ